MEWAVRDVILKELQSYGLHEEWDSVGAHVTFEHSAATLIGQPVELVVRVTSVGDDKPTVDAEAVFRDKVGELGRGTHRRMIVNMPKIRKRLLARQEVLEGGG